MDVSKIIKKITPGFIRKVQRAKRDELVKREFAGLSNKEVFEKIYSEKRWGSAKEVKRKFSSGDGTRDDIIVEKYINSVKEFFGPSAINLSAVDVGCGDFTVGSKIYKNFQYYFGVDVAPNVIEENRKLFNYNNVEFISADATSENLPKADIIFVRQVLQHLSNADIINFLKNINGRFRYMVLTESISSSKKFKPNIDIITGPGIRIHKKSGVVLEEYPFNFAYEKKFTILEYRKGKELFITKVFELKWGKNHYILSTALLIKPSFTSI